VKALESVQQLEPELGLGREQEPELRQELGREPEWTAAILEQWESFS
jgi:hypothetical protein